MASECYNVIIYYLVLDGAFDSNALELVHLISFNGCGLLICSWSVIKDEKSFIHSTGVIKKSVLITIFSKHTTFHVGTYVADPQ